MILKFSTALYRIHLENSFLLDLLLRVVHLDCAVNMLMKVQVLVTEWLPKAKVTFLGPTQIAVLRVWTSAGINSP